MAQYFQIHPTNPQQRLIRRAIEILRSGQVIVYPTDSAYSLACKLDEKTALERIRTIRRLDEKHNLSLVCKDLSQISFFARIDNEAYRLIKSLTPGPYTFILKATREVPRRLQHPNRKTIGIRIPDSPITLALVEELGEPLFSTSLILPGDTESLSDPEQIRERLERQVDLIIDGGTVSYAPSTIIEWIDDFPQIVRQGKGDVPALR